MTENLMRRMDGFCRLYLTLKDAGIPFPASGEIFTDGGTLCWSELDNGHLHLMMTSPRRRNDRLAGELKGYALALNLLSFVVHVPAQDWETTTIIECMVEPKDMSSEACYGISLEPMLCVNVRAHLHLSAPDAAERL